MKPKNKSKLTLTCDPDIVKEAKEYVKLEEESLSAVVEEFLSTYIRVKKNKQKGKYPFHTPEIRNLSGALHLGKHRDYKKEYKQ